MIRCNEVAIFVLYVHLFTSLIFQGEIALAFGDLLRKLWAPGATPVVPRVFKSKLARFAPQFSGFNQHDSQVSEVFTFKVAFLRIHGFARVLNFYDILI